MGRDAYGPYVKSEYAILHDDNISNATFRIYLKMLGANPSADYSNEYWAKMLNMSVRRFRQHKQILQGNELYIPREIGIHQYVGYLGTSRQPAMDTMFKDRKVK